MKTPATRHPTPDMRHATPRSEPTSPFPAPTRAIVLAAGLGERMFPLNLDLPKPAMPFHGRPLLWYTLRRLASWGVTDTLLNLHHGADEVMQTARRVQPPGMRLTFSYEPILMNTGGSLARASWFLKKDPVWIINGDIYFESLDPGRFPAALQSHQALAVLWMHPISGPRTVSLYPDGRIDDFAVPYPGAEGTVTFCGLHLVSPRILDFIPPDRPSSIINAYRGAIKQGHAIRGVVDDALWSDLGTPAGYLNAHAKHPDPAPLASNQSAHNPGRNIFCGSNVSFGSGCRLENCVIWDDVRIASRTKARNTIIGRGISIAGSIDRPTIALSRIGKPEFNALINRMGWPLESTAISPLAPRGSGRTFYRIHHGRRSAILIHDNGLRYENKQTAAYAAFLRELELPVPKLLAHDAKARLTILSDGGNRSLEDLTRESKPHRWLPVYEEVLNVMARWHNLGARRMPDSGLPQLRRFNPALFRWEIQYFDTHFLQQHTGMRPSLRRSLLGDLRAATRPLRALSQVLIHRDLQSSNVLLAGPNVMLIDFQGMRFGPAVYDLASLLYDPYVSINPDQRLKLLDRYRRTVGAGGYEVDIKTLDDDLFHRAGLQRLAQALGAFARLGAIPATKRFLDHIPAALRHMHQAAENIEGMPTLKDWLNE